MLTSLTSVDSDYATLQSDLSTASSTIGSVYESANINDVKSKMEALGDDLGSVIENIRSKISNKLSSLNDDLEDMKEEDEEYHDSEEDD